MKHEKQLYIILVSEFPPGQHGGIAHWASNLFNTLTASGQKTVVLTRKSTLHAHTKREKHGTVTYLSGRSWKNMNWLYVLPHLIPLLLTHKKPVVIAATWHNAAKLHRLKKVLPFTLYCSARGTDITKAVYPPGNKEQRQLLNVLKSVDVLIPISRFLDNLVRTTFPNLPFKSIIIGNDVDHTLFKPAKKPDKKSLIRKKMGIDPQARVLLTVGRMVPFKGFPDLIESLPAVIAKVPGLILLMVTSPREPEYSKIVSAIQANNLHKHVIITPPVEHHELPDMYHASDVFVLWSKAVYEPMYQEEGFGRTSIEAAACGLPVIVSDTGGQPETVIPGETGYIVPSGDKELLAQRIIELLLDQESAKAMGKKGRAFIERTYTADIMKEKILQLPRL